MKASKQHALAAKALSRRAHKCGIAELTEVERVAPEDSQGVHVHHQTVAGESKPPIISLPTVEQSLKTMLDEQVQKMCGKGQGLKEHKLYVPGAIILNELTLFWHESQPTPPPFVIIHLANPNNPLPGDTYNTQCHPDFVSRRATIQELKDYLNRLRSAPHKVPNIDDLRPAHGEVVSTVEMKR